MAAAAPPAAHGVVRGEVIAVRHLGRALHFADLSTSAGFQLCFDAELFRPTDQPGEPEGTSEEGSPEPWELCHAAFPHAKSELKPGDRVVAGYLMAARPSCAAVVRANTLHTAHSNPFLQGSTVYAWRLVQGGP